MARPPRIPAAALAAALALASPAPAHAALDAAWRALPAGVPADSIPAVLRQWELRGARGVRPGEAAYALAQFRYARGEYVQAEEAYLRAYARLDGPDRPAARYGQGLASLALGHLPAAREAFEQAAAAPAWRSLALWGTACAWDAEGRPEKAFDLVRDLLAGDPGEAAAPALERAAALATRFHRDSEAQAARTRLLRQYPRSVEAARARAAAGGLEGGRAPSRLPAP